MSSFAARQKTAQSERRRSGRLLIEIPVGFKTVTGVRPCHMGNISDAGAMLEMENPPATGISGWLVMGEDEIYATVAWSSEGTCGMEFERPLGVKTLDNVVAGKEREYGPAANRGNIQMGRKRASLVPRGE